MIDDNGDPAHNVVSNGFALSDVFATQRVI